MKFFLSILVVLLFVGCGAERELTKDDFMKIKEGMTEAEVVKVLGKPKESKRAGSFNGQPMKLLIWEEDTDVMLFGGKVGAVTFKGEDLIEGDEE